MSYVYNYIIIKQTIGWECDILFDSLEAALWLRLLVLKLKCQLSLEGSFLYQIICYES